MPTIDFRKAIDDAKGASFEALPIGDYDVEVGKSEATTSSNGKPMIKVTMRVISGPYEKRPIINNFVLSLENAQATAIFFRHMKAFGLTEEWFASLGQTQSLEPVAQALLNRRARLSVGHREWQGEMRNEVKGVKPYTGAPGAPNGALPGPGSALPITGGPTAPTAPVAPPAPIAQVAPVAPPPPAPVAAPLVAPPAAPQVQSVPQPPAPEAPVAVPSVPTTSPTVESPPSAPSVATSDVPMTPAPPAPPALPF